MISHSDRSIANRMTSDLQQSQTAQIALPPSAPIDVPPLTPSERLPLIAHTLREARVAIAELRYEGRGGTCGFVTEFHDPHRIRSLTSLIDERIAQQLTGVFWQMVLRRQPAWSDNAGSFGVVTWDLKTDRLRHVHHQRVPQLNTSTVEGL
jgi:hypothetical protein